MTTIAAPICLGCKHFRDASKSTPTLSCDAFPAGIPDSIIESIKDHREPVNGDRGIRFVARDDSASSYADLLFRAPAKG